jgi:tRNA nucleotidyltransferase (CCA-adding enzyme)
MYNCFTTYLGENHLDSNIPAFLASAAEAFKNNNTPLYLVGGWPRNRLLGLKPGDLDVSSELPPGAAMEIFAGVPGVRIVPRDTRMGTFGVLSGGVHRPDAVSFGATMREDALRRDFTANALYHDIAAARDIDPLGGLPDLAAKLLRTCRAPQETFADDGLRLMRLVRFACELGFGIEKETFETAQRNAGLLRDISPERIQVELNKILLADTRYPDKEYQENPVLAGLTLLNELGQMDMIAPEFSACRGVKQRADYHDHDVLVHLLHTAACAPPVLELRLAALLHDIGKPVAVKQTGRMLGHDKLGEGMAREILLRLRYPSAVADEVAALVRGHMYDLDGRTGESRLRLFFVKMGKERAWKLVEVRRADICGSRDEQEQGDPAEKWVRILEKMDVEHVPWTQKDLDIGGGDLAELAGGPSETVGRLKCALHEHAVLHPQDNRKDTLLRLAIQMARDTQRFGGKGNGREK